MTLDEYNHKYKNAKPGENHLDDLEDDLIKACEEGHLDAVKFLLTSPELPFHADIHCDKDYPLLIACKFGHLDIAKYLCTSSELTEKVTDELWICNAVKEAISFGNLDIVKFFLTSSELSSEQKLSIHKYGGDFLVCASEDGESEIIKYLLTSPDLKAHPNIHFKEDTAFRYAVVNKDFELLRFFIFDMNIEITKRIENFLKIGVSGYNEEIDEVKKCLRLGN